MNAASKNGRGSTPIRRLAQDSSLYALGTLIQRAAQFLLVPLYTATLSKSEYGALETLSALFQGFSILANFGLSSALIRFYSECKDEDEVAVMVRTSSILAVALSLVALLLLVPFARSIAMALFKDVAFAKFVILALLWSSGAALNQQLFAYYRARQKPLLYVGFSLGMFVALVCLNVASVRFLELGLFGILLGYLVVDWGVNFWLIRKFWLKERKLSWKWGRALLLFGGPLVLSMGGWLILNSADRYFLAFYRDLSEVGLYGLGYKAGLVLQVGVIAPFQLAWGPFVFSRFRDAGDTDSQGFSRVFTYLILLTTFVGLGILVFSPLIVRILGSGRFNAAAAVVPYVLIATLFTGVYYWAASMFHLTKHTAQLSVIIVAMAFVSIILNYLWVPTWGWLGAAIATVVTLGGVGVLTLLVGQRYYRVPIEWIRLLKIAMAAVPIVTINGLLPVPIRLLDWVLRVSLLLLFPLLMILLKFLHPSETRLALIWIRTFKRTR